MKNDETVYSSALAYYQGRWVLVPMRYIPKDTQEDIKSKEDIVHCKSSEVYQGEFAPIST